MPMMLSIQIAKLKFHQYQVRAVSQNFILPKLSLVLNMMQLCTVSLRNMTQGTELKSILAFECCIKHTTNTLVS